MVVSSCGGNVGGGAGVDVLFVVQWKNKCKDRVVVVVIIIVSSAFLCASARSVSGILCLGLGRNLGLGRPGHLLGLGAGFVAPIVRKYRKPYGFVAPIVRKYAKPMVSRPRSYGHT